MGVGNADSSSAATRKRLQVIDCHSVPSRLRVAMATSLSDSGYGSGRRRARRTSVNTVVFAPTPSASDPTTAAVKPGERHSRRAAPWMRRTIDSGRRIRFVPRNSPLIQTSAVAHARGSRYSGFSQGVGVTSGYATRYFNRQHDWKTRWGRLLRRRFGGAKRLRVV